MERSDFATTLHYTSAHRRKDPGLVRLGLVNFLRCRLIPNGEDSVGLTVKPEAHDQRGEVSMSGRNDMRGPF